MCNCGSNRSMAGQQGDTTMSRNPVMFEYTGQTALTVTGPYSGMRYRFNAPGSRLRVDFRDVPALSSIRVLRALNA